MLFSVVFATNFWLFSNRELVDDFLKSEGQPYESQEERRAADDRQQAIEQALERPGMVMLMSLQTVWVSMYSLLSFWSLLWLLNGISSSSWASFNKWCSAATLSTIVLSLGAFVNTLSRLTFRRFTATASLAMFIHAYDARNILQFLGSSLDLFTIWYLFLVATSTSILCKQDLWSAFLLTTGSWIALLLCSFIISSSFAFIF